MSTLKRLLSYLFPVNVHRQKSDISQSLEISWNDGQLVLDSANTNYSYGSLQRILRLGLLRIGTERVRAAKSVLILGVGGGSVIRTLIDEIGYRGPITGVELDPAVIQISKQYFSLDEIPHLDLVHADAFDYVLSCKTKYDLIIIDIFKDVEMPVFLFEQFFTLRIANILSKGGCVLFNTMLLTASDQQRNQRYSDLWDPAEFEVNTLPKVENHNELFVIHRKQTS